MATGATQDTQPVTMNEEPCPQCGDQDHTRWIDSNVESDTWECIACGKEWAIPIIEPTRSPQKP